jgi:hypothetical protein
MAIALQPSPLAGFCMWHHAYAVHAQGKEPEKYFVSGGFSLTHADSVAVSTLHSLLVDLT